MPKQTIILNCAAGVSTLLLVTKMQQAAKKEKVDAKIFDCPASEAKNHISNE